MTRRNALVRINWGWMRYRWQHIRHCRGDRWEPGDRLGGSIACSRCGVWRWFPLTIRRRKHLR